MKKLFSHKSFLIGFIIVGFFILIAIPGYLIAPDNTNNCNDIIPATANQPPGFSSEIIRINNTGNIENTSFFSIWLNGRNAEGSGIAIAKGSAVLKGDSLMAKELETGDPIAYKKTDLVQKDGNFVFKRTYWLGSDRFGRDVLSRLIIGARVSLFVGFVSVIISLLIGTVIGLFAGYSGGITDNVLSWFIAVFWSVPTLLIALGLSFVLGKGLIPVLVSVGLSTWVEVARVVRGQTMQLKEKEFVMAAKITGFSKLHILFKHILPNLKSTLTVLATTNFAAAILLEAGLSFLGLGIDPPAPSWGIMVKEHLGNLVLPSYYLAIVPGIAIMLLVMAFNLVSMGLRDTLDTRLK